MGKQGSSGPPQAALASARYRNVSDRQPIVMQARIRRNVPSDHQAISNLAMTAFGSPEGPEIAQLIADLSIDESAQPVLSLVATVDDDIIGHILFSKVRLQPPVADISAALLAPLAVHPEFQSQGIGSRLVTTGLRHLSASGVDLVFVLGHPGYYPRFGFSEAGIKGYEAPYPIAHENAAAWMVLELHPGAIEDANARVICANALAAPKYWRE